MSTVWGPGEDFLRFFEAAEEAGGFPREAAGVMKRAFEGAQTFRARPYRLAEGVEWTPGHTQIWGVLNITPDSFSDGGRFFGVDRAMHQAERMVEEGVDVIDLGGESTRPGAAPVGADEEMGRVIPVLRGIRERWPVPLSIDTAKAEVAREALAAGAVVVNDVTALRGDPEMAQAVVEGGAGVVLMHMKGTPRTMQKDPHYDDLYGEVARRFRESLSLLDRAGGAPAMLDPGIGFGKTLEHNLRLIKGMRIFGAMGHPLLLGPSRKSFLGMILDLPVDERLEGTAAAVAAGVLGGAAALRVHDIREMGRVVRVATAIDNARGDAA
ncbi:MAG: dihydropteroate synthase [Planctomycetota bacterium]